MKITDIYKKKKTVFSFEVFPPKSTSPIETIRPALDELIKLKPDFVSVTYGAGGSAVDLTTIGIASLLKNEYGIESLFHLTCLRNSKSDIDSIVEKLKENNIENILALRGDANPNVPSKHDFRYASELTAYLKEKGDFSVSGACYPECHLEAANIIEDIKNLKKKVDAGASHLISQLFFDNEIFFSFIDQVRAEGIDVPIEAGIMPVVSKSQIERMVTLCGASLPRKFTAMMQRFESHPEALREAGIAYATDQIIDLVSRGVDGIHIYSMNNPYVVRKIYENIAPIIEASNE